MRKSDRICMGAAASAAESVKVGCGYQSESASLESTALKLVIRCHVSEHASEDPVPERCGRFWRHS